MCIRDRKKPVLFPKIVFLYDENLHGPGKPLEDVFEAGIDVYKRQEMHWLPAPRIDNPNTHGTGCTLSSAIACGLAHGVSLVGSVKRAKRYLTACIDFKLDLGRGSGPLQHRIADWENWHA